MKLVSHMKIKNIFTSLFLLLSFTYLLKTLLILILLFTLNQQNIKTYIPEFNLIRYFPYYGYFPIINIIASLVFLHISLKIREESRLSWILAVVFLILVPYFTIRLNNIILLPFSNLSQTYSGILGHLHAFIAEEMAKWWKDPSILLSGFIFILLILSFKKFPHEGHAFSKKQLGILLSFLLFIVIPVVSITFYMFHKGYFTDFNHASLQKKLGYHIYVPTYFPDDRVYDSVFRELKNKQYKKPVLVSFNYSPTVTIEEHKNGPINVLEADGTGVDLNNIVSNDRSEITNKKNVPISFAKNSHAVMKFDKNREFIYFITKDNTLIMISGYFIDQEELVKFANSLR